MARNSITYALRKEIEERLQHGDRIRDIAYHLNLSQSALYAEVRRGLDSNGDYSADLGEETYAANIRKRGNRTSRTRAEANG